MCLLTFFPPGVMPDTAALLNGAYLNDDGHGFAIVTGNEIIVRRGMYADDMVEQFEVTRRQHRSGPALFHSRFATHGTTNIDNCHPFPVGADPRTVLAHNGILPPVVQPSQHDPRSDTRIAADEFIPVFGYLRSRRTRMRLQRWMTPHNKIVILTVDRRFKQRAYILNEQSGIWDGDIWYSNDGYLIHTQGPWTRFGEYDADMACWELDEHGIARCDFCWAIIDRGYGRCPACGGCTECGEMPGDCFCYTPASLDTRTLPARR